MKSPLPRPIFRLPGPLPALGLVSIRAADPSRRQSCLRRTAFPSAAVAMLLTVAPVHGDTFEWDGSRSSPYWDSQHTSFPFDTNWNVFSAYPGAGDIVLFSDSAARYDVHLNGTRQVDSVAFLGGRDYRIYSNTLVLSTGRLTSDGTARHTIDSNVQIGADAYWDIDGVPVLA